jgi:hypothetical protein
MQRNRYIARLQLAAAVLLLLQGTGHAQTVRYVPGKMAIVYDGRQYKSPGTDKCGQAATARRETVTLHV